MLAVLASRRRRRTAEEASAGAEAGILPRISTKDRNWLLKVRDNFSKRIGEGTPTYREPLLSCLTGGSRVTLRISFANFGVDRKPCWFSRGNLILLALSYFVLSRLCSLYRCPTGDLEVTALTNT